MADHAKMRLGKKPRKHDPRTLKLARYLTPELPSAPPVVDYTGGVSEWGMMLNDQLGCCTIAAVAHAVQVWAGMTAHEITLPDSTILQYYEQWDGYNPAQPLTDQGGVELDVLNQWRQQGFAGHALDAYAAIELQEPGVRSQEPGEDLRAAIWLFGGIYIGLELPLSAQTQDIWGVAPGSSRQDAGATDDPGSWGGHAVYVVSYDCPQPPAPSAQPPTFTCITWGQLKKMTWPWFAKYCSEAYALISKDWIKASGVAPSGFDLGTLEEDLRLVIADC
jgi:hypothetical protein